MTAVRALLAILVNAAVQAALVEFAAVETSTPLVALATVGSGLVLLLTALVLSSSAVRGRGVSERVTGAGRLRFIGWLLVVLIIGFLGNIAWPNAGTLIAGVFAVLPIAALAGWPGLRGWAATLRDRPVKWFFVTLAMGLGLVLLHLAAGVNTFFVGGWVGAAAAWVVAGLVAWWWLRVLAGLVPKRHAVQSPELQEQAA